MFLAKKILLVSALLALSGVTFSSMAATTTLAGPSFAVKIKVNNTCDVTNMTAGDIDFGTHDFNDGTVTQTSTIAVKCTSGNIFKIGLDEGANAATPSDTTSRRMTDGTHYIAYDLLQAAGGAHWGNTSTDSLPATGDGTAQSYTVHATATLDGTEPAGDYTDTVVASVTF